MLPRTTKVLSKAVKKFRHHDLHDICKVHFDVPETISTYLRTGVDYIQAHIFLDEQ